MNWSYIRVKIATTLLLLSAVGPVRAQLTAFELTDGAAFYRAENLVGQRLGENPGTGALNHSGTQNPMQHWFWYRAGDDPREYAVSNQVEGEIINERTAQMRYEEPVTGVGNTALSIFINYELNDLGDGTARLFIAFGVQNVSTATIGLNFYSYFDIDVANSPTDDLAIIDGASNQLQHIWDASAPVSHAYGASSQRLVAYEISAFPSIRAKLTDSAADSLSNSGSPFGPGDYSGAFGWFAELAPSDAIFIGSISQTIEVVPEPTAIVGVATGIGLLAGRALSRRRRKTELP